MYIRFLKNLMIFTIRNIWSSAASKTGLQHMNFSRRCLVIWYSSLSSTLPWFIQECTHMYLWIWQTIDDHFFIHMGDRILVHEWIFIFHPMSHVNGMETTSTLYGIDEYILYGGEDFIMSCWGSASFIKNTAQSLNHLGIRVGIWH